MQKLIALLMLAFWLSCTKEPSDPCQGKICQNGGVCVNGICQCAPHYTGENCEQQVTPLLITIHAIEVTNVPQTDANGAGWDLTSGPDVYVVIKQNGQTLLSTASDWRQNANDGALWNYGFATNEALQPVVIEVYDYDDFDADDFMGAMTGNLYSPVGGFPSFFTANCGSCNIQVKFGPMEYL